jgi:hypothetical protein
MTLAQQFAEDRADLPTSLGSAELRKLGNDVLRQSLFSARMSNAEAVQALRNALRGAKTLAERRYMMKVAGEALGYSPETGFPGSAPGLVPPAEAGEIRDLFSTDRLNLVLNTQQEMAQGAAKNIWGNEPDALEQYPAWELVRVAAVDVPRGLIRRGKGVLEPVPEDAWDTANGRWVAALLATGDTEAQSIFDATERMVARKDSDVWAALGDGAGGHDDALGNDYEPFAFNSGMGRVEVSRQEFADLGGSLDDLAPSDTDFGSGTVKLPKGRFDPDILQQLKTGLESGDIKFRVKVEVV